MRQKYPAPLRGRQQEKLGVYAQGFCAYNRAYGTGAIFSRHGPGKARMLSGQLVPK